MAPLPHAKQHNSIFFVKRVISDSTLISIVIPLVILSIFTVTASSFFIQRYITQRAAARREKEESGAPTPPPLAERRPSDWARQNSNVLWSMYINDDDLRAQFSKPSKDSRLFSIGSVSTVGPLDTLPVGRPSVLVEHDEKPIALNQKETVTAAKPDDEKVYKTIPRRATYANLQTQRVNGRGWLGGFGKRKTSLTTA